MIVFQVTYIIIKKNLKNGFYNLVRRIGIEPITSGAEIRRSIPVSYTHLTLPTNREV